MNDESYRATPHQGTPPEEIAATYAAIQQTAANSPPRATDQLRDVILQRLEAELPDQSFIILYELAGDIAKDVRSHTHGTA